jgi:hypothetical protein
VLHHPLQGGGVESAKGQEGQKGDQMVHSACAGDKCDGHYGYRSSVKTHGHTEGGHGGWVGVGEKTKNEGVR